MRCPIETGETSEILLAWCARRLDPGTAAVVERHVAACPACRGFYEAQRAVWEALDAWEAIPVAPDFDQRLYGRIESEAAAPWWQRAMAPRGGPGVLRRALPLAAAACLLVAAIGIMEPWATSLSEPGLRADQVERTLEDLELLDAFTREVRAQAQPSSAL